MYIIEASNGIGIATKAYKRLPYARKEAARVTITGKIYIPNKELWSWQNWFTVKSVRLYDSKAPDIDIDF